MKSASTICMRISTDIASIAANLEHHRHSDKRNPLLIQVAGSEERSGEFMNAKNINSNTMPSTDRGRQLSSWEMLNLRPGHRRSRSVAYANWCRPFPGRRRAGRPDGDTAALPLLRSVRWLRSSNAVGVDIVILSALLCIVRQFICLYCGNVGIWLGTAIFASSIAVGNAARWCR